MGGGLWDLRVERSLLRGWDAGVEDFAEGGEVEDGFEVAVAFDEAGAAVWKLVSVSLASRKRLPSWRSISVRSVRVGTGIGDGDVGGALRNLYLESSSGARGFLTVGDSTSWLRLVWAFQVVRPLRMALEGRRGGFRSRVGRWGRL